jgi:hypothetical protein
LCHLQHKLIGFYNRDEKCLQRGTDWVFKQSGLRFVCQGYTVLVWSIPVTVAQQFMTGKRFPVLHFCDYSLMKDTLRSRNM